MFIANSKVFPNSRSTNLSENNLCQKKVPERHSGALYDKKVQLYNDLNM